MIFKSYVCKIVASVVMTMTCPLLAEIITPVLVGSIACSGSDDFYRDVKVIGNYAYVAGNGAASKYPAFRVINISDKTHPVLTASIGSIHTAAVQIVGNYAYVADNLAENAALRIINIANLGSLSWAGAVENCSRATGVVVVGDYAYITCYHFFMISNIANPESPVVTARLEMSDCGHINVIGNYAYVLDLNNLKIINITDPVAPVVVGSFSLSGTVCYDLAVVGSYAYVACSSSGLKIINVANPGSPTLVGSLSTTSSFISVTVAGNYAYVGDSGGLEIVNITNPVAPVVVGTFRGLYSAVKVTVVDNYAYVADFSEGLKILKLWDNFPGDLSSSSSTGSSTFLSSSSSSSSAGKLLSSSSTGFSSSSSSSSSTGLLSSSSTGALYFSSSGVFSSSSTGISSSSTGSNIFAPNPVAHDIVKSGTTNIPLVFSAEDFISNFTDTPGNNLMKIKITSLPDYGTLKLSGRVIAINQEIAFENLSKLTYVPEASWNGSDSFKWNGSDGILYGNDDADVTITIDPIITPSFCTDHSLICYVIPPVVSAAGIIIGVLKYTHKNNLWCFKKAASAPSGVQLANNIP